MSGFVSHTLYSAVGGAWNYTPGLFLPGRIEKESNRCVHFASLFSFIFVLEKGRPAVGHGPCGRVLPRYVGLAREKGPMAV